MAMLSSHIVSAVLWPSSSSSSSSSALVLQHRRRKPSLRWLRKPAVAGRSLHCITPPPAPSGGEGQAVVAPTTSVASLARRGAEGFDREGFEAERLRLDAEARVSMQEVSRSVEMGGSETEAPGAWKWAIRKRIWDLMEREDIAQNPRPVHHRIPNFVGAGAAAGKLASLPEFQSARCIKVNPDSPQKQVRYLTLNGGKKLLTPQPRLRTGFFSELDASLIPRAALSEACTPAGVAKNGKPLGLDAILKVDLIVIGSVAVDPKSGARLGKGEGFAELEYGMLRHMGAIDDSTLVVTSVHDKQLVDDIPVEKLLVHDVPVDVICTPTQIIYTNTTIPKPKGIYWDKLSPEKLGQIRVLRELKQRIERETGVKLPSGPSEKLPPTAERKPFGQGRETPNSSVLVWNLDARTRWQELKDHVARLGLPVLRVNVFKQPGYSKPVARVFFRQDANLQSAINTLNGSDLGGTLLRAKPDDAP